METDGVMDLQRYSRRSGFWIRYRSGPRLCQVTEHLLAVEADPELYGISRADLAAMRTSSVDRESFRETVLLLVMRNGCIRVRGHSDYTTFQFCEANDVRAVADAVAEFLRFCRFDEHEHIVLSNLAVGRSVRTTSGDVVPGTRDLLVNLRSRQVLHVGDVAAHVLSNPESIGVDPDEVAGLDLLFDRPCLVALALSVGWVVARPARAKLGCRYAGSWPQGFRSALRAIRYTGAEESALLDLVNCRYRRRLDMACGDFVRLAAPDGYGALIRRTTPAVVDRALASATSTAATREHRRALVRRRAEAERLIRTPRPVVPVNGDRGRDRLVHLGATSYLSPVPLFVQVECTLSGLSLVLAKTHWALVVMDELPDVSSEVEAFRVPHGTRIGLLSEITDRDRFHLSWSVALLLQTRTGFPVRESVLERARGFGNVTALVRSDDDFLLVTPGEGQHSLPAFRPSVEAIEEVLSADLPPGCRHELVGTAYPGNFIAASAMAAGGWAWLAGTIPVLRERER